MAWHVPIVRNLEERFTNLLILLPLHTLLRPFLRVQTRSPGYTDVTLYHHQHLPLCPSATWFPILLLPPPSHPLSIHPSIHRPPSFSLPPGSLLCPCISWTRILIMDCKDLPSWMDESLSDDGKGRRSSSEWRGGSSKLAGQAGECSPGQAIHSVCGCVLHSVPTTACVCVWVSALVCMYYVCVYYVCATRLRIPPGCEFKGSGDKPSR